MLGLTIPRGKHRQRRCSPLTSEGCSFACRVSVHGISSDIVVVIHCCLLVGGLGKVEIDAAVPFVDATRTRAELENGIEDMQSVLRFEIFVRASRFTTSRRTSSCNNATYQVQYTVPTVSYRIRVYSTRYCIRFASINEKATPQYRSSPYFHPHSSKIVGIVR
jgi:hypothetical protein